MTTPGKRKKLQGAAQKSLAVYVSGLFTQSGWTAGPEESANRASSIERIECHHEAGRLSTVRRDRPTVPSASLLSRKLQRGAAG